MRTTPSTLLLLAAAGLLVCAGEATAATTPFGVGLPEPPPTGGGLFPTLFHWIAAEQRSFYQALTGAVRAMKADGSAGLLLAGLSFAYGVLHAIGPGHGKAIVAAYVLANRETARNAAILSLVSALAQAVTAVTLVSVLSLAFGATSMAMTATAGVMETGSFALIAALGLWLVWRKIVQPARAWAEARYAPVLVSAGGLALAGPAGSLAAAAQHRPERTVRLTYTPSRSSPPAAAHDHGPDCGCGHAHGPSAAVAAQPLNWRSAWSTVVAVGLRPCTGALIVLVFAASQGLFSAGIGAAFAMALGTGLTVAGLTLSAVFARGLALGLAGETSPTARQAHRLFEGGGALVVLLFGLTMLAANLIG